MSIYNKETKSGLRWYYQIMRANIYHRGGGFETKQEAINAEIEEGKYRRKRNYRKKKLARKRQNWRKNYHQHPECDRERHLMDSYSISSDEYQLLFNKQNGVCAICGKPPTNGKPLQVDHDHTTGKIRGLLCHKCNTGIGYLGDVTQSVQYAVNYLKENSL